MNSLGHLRVLGRLEGYSFLFLLLIAMPLKYAFLFPMATRIAGALHGGLFLIYLMTLVGVARERQWPARKLSLGAFLAMIPLGTFYFDRELKKDLSGGDSR